MALREDLFNPISESAPCGENLRYSPVYLKINEARREENDLVTGQSKTVDYAVVIRLAEDALATKSKDLQLAAWMAEGLTSQQGFAGLRDGLSLCLGLLERFWEGLYPEIEDGDAELRAAPLEGMSRRLEHAVRSVKLVNEGYNTYEYQDSRSVGYENQVNSDKERETRERKLAEGKLDPELFDKAFLATPKAYYLQAERDLDASLKTLEDIQRISEDKFGDDAPSFGKFKGAMEEVRRVVHTLLQKKRETEPDPIEPSQPEASAAVGAGSAAATTPAVTATAGASILSFSTETPERRQAIAAVCSTAAFLRQRDPLSPAPYLMLRGLRWGELRAAIEKGDATALEAPPTELRRTLKALSIDRKWEQLLEAAETAMALPCSRAWLDLQRAVVEACSNLGPQYAAISQAICSELRALLRDFPQLFSATLMDDTPAANVETQTWLREVVRDEPSQSPAVPDDASEETNGWPKRSVHAFQRAQDALKAGQEQKAFDIMRREIASQVSGRGRFLQKLRLVELCISAGKEDVAQILLDDITAAMDEYKLESWEDPALIGSILLILLKSSRRINEDSSLRQTVFERLCRLDPALALSVGG